MGPTRFAAGVLSVDGRVPELAPAPGDLAPGEVVDHYRILRLLGRGGMGEVYLARDTRLGRKAAIKVIHPRWRLSAEAGHQLLREARATARFNHPHIVTVYAVGEHRGRPYVALEYLEGQTLRERLRGDAMGTLEACRVGLAVAEALAVAHGRGILHRDLKPSNIVIPRDGRIRVVDFGLAMITEAAAADVSCPEAFSLASAHGELAPLCGTPLYMAPERWAGVADGGAADIWALGLVLCEMILDAHPFAGLSPDELRAAIKDAAPVALPPADAATPPEILALLQRCLAKDPTRRPVAAELAEELASLLRTAPTRRHVEEEPPFRGLLPFSESHGRFFFGRDDEVAAVVERQREQPLLAIIGPPGVGKSSFVQAGVIPRLRERGPLTVLQLRPGTQPLMTLASKLLVEGPTNRAWDDVPSASGSTGGELAEQSSRAERISLALALRNQPALLALKLRELADENHCRVLLYIDQLEELFTITAGVDERRAFLQAITTAADDPSDPVRVVVTVRDDFFYRMTEGGGPRAALTQVVTIHAPDEQLLTQVLVRPLELIGYRYEDPQLVSEMVAAVHGELACLPILQFGARLLWERRDHERRLLLRASYEEIGGLGGALARHAEAVLAGLTTTSRELARRLLLRLVTPAGTRRALDRRELLEALGQDGEAVADLLIQQRLLVQRRSTVTGEPELELAHETLVTSWAQLRRWLAESDAERRALDELRQAAELWERRGQRAEEVWSGEALKDGLRAVDRCDPTEAPARVRRFLAAGERAARRQARRQRRRIIGGMGLLAVLAICAVVVALVLSRQKRAIETQRVEVLRRHGEALLEGARSALLRGHPLEARAKLREALETEDDEAARVLWWRAQREPLVWSAPLSAYTPGLAFSADGRHIVSATFDSNVRVIDASTGALLHLFRAQPESILCAGLAPRGEQLVSGSVDGTIWRWSLETFTGHSLADRHRDGVSDLAFSGDEQRFVSASLDGRIGVWRARDGALERMLAGHVGPVYSVALPASGRLMASGGDDRTVRIWELPQGRLLRTLGGHAERVFVVRLTGDGKIVAAGGLDGTVRLWDVHSGKPLRTFSGHTDRVVGLDFSPRGGQLVSSSYDGTIRIWDLRGGRPPRVLRVGRRVYRAIFSPDGARVASSDEHNALRLWDLAVAAPREAQGGHAAGIPALRFSPDGTRIATGSSDRTVRLWDARSGRALRVLRDDGVVWSVAFAPRGETIYTSNGAASISVWRARDGSRLGELRTPARRVAVDLALSPDGRTLASVGHEPAVQLWDLAEQRWLRGLVGHRGFIKQVVFSPDGARLASSGQDGTVRLWQLAGGQPLRTLDRLRAPAVGLAFSPDGERLAIAVGSGELQLWDLRSGALRRLAGFPCRATAVAVSPDGAVIGVALSNGEARLIGARDGRQTVLRADRGRLLQVRFSPDGRRVATAGDDGALRLWDPRSGRPLWNAPLLDPAGPRLFTTQGGWIALGRDRPAGGDPWDRAPLAALLRERARHVALAPASGLACAATVDDALELWDTRLRRRLGRATLPGLEQVVALDEGCVALARGRALLYRRRGTPLRLVDRGATVVAWAAPEIVVAAPSRVQLFSPAGEARSLLSTRGRVTAVDRRGARLLLGYETGMLEARSLGAKPRIQAPPFEELPTRRTTLVRWLSDEHVLAGHDDGHLGLWSLRTGRRLAQARLHGPVVHALWSEGTLHVVSELGDHLTWDLGVLTRRYCELLREVWRQAPFLWRRGSLRRAAPRSHRCSPQ